MVAGFEKTRRAARLSDVRGDDAGRRCSAGCLVGFTSQVSIHPRRFLVGPSKRNHTYRVAQHAEQLAVNVVPRSHCDLARLFGSETGDETDKFARCSWRPSPAGLPILQDAAGWFVGDVLSRFDLSDSDSCWSQSRVAHRTPSSSSSRSPISAISIPATRQ
jgi:flavin reductase (DIM6/NTAB) family NADH-FMN oxidoreductase RutF